MLRDDLLRTSESTGCNAGRNAISAGDRAGVHRLSALICGLRFFRPTSATQRISEVAIELRHCAIRVHRALSCLSRVVEATAHLLCHREIIE